jgi:hypothetical protein
MGKVYSWESFIDGKKESKKETVDEMRTQPERPFLSYPTLPFVVIIMFSSCHDKC